ncbi:MAG: DUF3482 domain-containing protein [Polyangiales bacterium]
MNESDSSKKLPTDLRNLEESSPRDRRVYLHQLNDWEHESPIGFDDEPDLFAKETWDVMGLSPRTLLTLTTLTGAAAGGAIDAAVGLASFFTGTVIGGIGGLGVGVYELSRRYASASNLAEQAKQVLTKARGRFSNSRLDRISVAQLSIRSSLARDRAFRSCSQMGACAAKPSADLDENSPRLLDDLDNEIRRALGGRFRRSVKIIAMFPETDA